MIECTRCRGRSRTTMFSQINLSSLCIIILLAVSFVPALHSMRPNSAYPRSAKSQLLQHQLRGNIHRLLLPACLVLGTTAATAASAKAEGVQGKLEYQPILQGLDYGKVLAAHCQIASAEGKLNRPHRQAVLSHTSLFLIFFLSLFIFDALC